MPLQNFMDGSKMNNVMTQMKLILISYFSIRILQLFLFLLDDYSSSRGIKKCYEL